MLNILNEIAVEEENANLDVTRPGRREWASTRAASIITWKHLVVIFTTCYRLILAEAGI